MTPEQLARMPNFFLLGAAKCGTTSVYQMLKKHPEIYMSKDKETHFFHNDRKYGLGVSYYLDTYFSGSESYPARGEASPEYLATPADVAPRIRDTCATETLKFVIILRDPVQRAYSHYRHQIRHCVEKRSFAEALRLEEQRLIKNPKRNVGYYSDGLYGKQMSHWLEYFAPEKFLVIRYEDLKIDWRGTLQRVCVHLGVNPEFEWQKATVANKGGDPRNRLVMRLVADPPRLLRAIGRRVVKRRHVAVLRRNIQGLNSRPTPAPRIDENLEGLLRELYAPDIELLEQQTGQDFSRWKPAFANGIESRANA